MAGATFGRKGIGSAEPVRRRTEFLVSTQPSEDEVARRRDAFLASERARAEQAVEVESAHPEALAALRPAGVAGEKSLTKAYLFWLLLGGISAHRFYLGRPLTGVIQTALWYVSLMFYMAGYGEAIFTLAAGVLWILADGYLIIQMHREANEKLQERAAPID